MDALENINLLWNEVTLDCFKGLWGNIWPDLSKYCNTRDFVVDINDIAELIKQTGSDKVTVI